MTRTHYGRGAGNGKRVNITTHFGIMGGLAPQKNIPVLVHRAYREKHATTKLVIPKGAEKGLKYMSGQNPMGRNMLSKNPACSGGVSAKSASVRTCGNFRW